MSRREVAHACLALSPRRDAWIASRTVCIVIGVVASIVAITALVAVIYPMADLAPDSRFPAIALGASVTTLAACVAVPLAFRAQAIAAGREVYAEDEQWLAGLPFAVKGYFTVIGRSRWVKETGRFSVDESVMKNKPDVFFDVQVRLSYRGAAPPARVMRELLDGSGPPLAGRPYDARKRTFSFSGASRAAGVARCARHLIRELLPALHDQFSLASVELAVEGD